MHARCTYIDERLLFGGKWNWFIPEANPAQGKTRCWLGRQRPFGLGRAEIAWVPGRSVRCLKGVIRPR